MNDFLSFAEDLEVFNLLDIKSACDKIGSRPRKEGELAFPDLGTMFQEIRHAKDIREPGKSQSLLELEAHLADVKANPDKYFDATADPILSLLFKRKEAKDEV